MVNADQLMNNHENWKEITIGINWLIGSFSKGSVWFHEESPHVDAFLVQWRSKLEITRNVKWDWWCVCIKSIMHQFWGRSWNHNDLTLWHISVMLDQNDEFGSFGFIHPNLNETFLLFSISIVSIAFAATKYIWHILTFYDSLTHWMYGCVYT